MLDVFLNYCVNFTAITTWIFNFLFTASADFPYNGQAIGDGVNRNSAIIGGRKNVPFSKIFSSMTVTELQLVTYSSYLWTVGKLHPNEVK